MESRIDGGEVYHRRVRLAENAFRYSIYLLYLDLAEIEELGPSVKRFRHNQPGWISFYDRDHGPRDGSSLREWIDGILGRVGIDLAGGPVRLLTLPRGAGVRFYPVSFWYCWHADGSLRAVLAEVHNTFGGRHNYLLHRSGEPLAFKEHLHAEKVFHVSPFVGMNAHYRFTFSEPGERLSVLINEDEDGEPLFTAGVSLTARPVDDATCKRLSWRHGSMPLKAWLLIHFQAIRLFAKGVRFHPDPGLPGEETSLEPQPVIERI